MSNRQKSALLFAIAMSATATTSIALSFLFLPYHVAIALLSVPIAATLGYFIGALRMPHSTPKAIAKAVIYSYAAASASIFLAALIALSSYRLWSHLAPSIGHLPPIGAWVFADAAFGALTFAADGWLALLISFLLVGIMLVRLSRAASNNSFKPTPLRGAA